MYTQGPYINKNGHIYQATPCKPLIKDGADPLNDMRRHVLIATMSHEVSYTENRANGDLLALAPEMLEIIKSLVNSDISVCGEFGGTECVFCGREFSRWNGECIHDKDCIYLSCLALIEKLKENS